MPEVQVCIECGADVAPAGAPCDGEKLALLVQEILATSDHQALSYRAVACLGNCDHRCRISLADASRWSWIFGDISPERDEAFLRSLFVLWLAAPKGLIAKKNRSDELKHKALGRLPPMV